MTKQEKIREAWGEHFEAVKNHVDENGWIYTRNFIFYCGFEYDEKGFGATHRIRPKSLAGIENNNGWVKIENKEDFPKIDFITQYWFFDGASTWISTFTLEMKLGRVKITHYQPIIKPKPPIY